MDKLKILPSDEKTWEKKENLWEENRIQAEKKFPLKGFSKLPKMMGITQRTKKFLKTKALSYLIFHDKNKILQKYVLKRPLYYGIRLLRAYIKRKTFSRNQDFFFYGLENEDELIKGSQKENAIFVVGFSYCHKPFECPSGRFSSLCQNAPTNPVCQQCFIGKCSSLLEGSKAHIVYIPTIHYIGEELLKLAHTHKDSPIYFLITACELSLVMFSDWGYMMNAKGIGVRLDGRICNTMQAFILSEKGTKPGLTLVLEETKKRILSLLHKITYGSICKID